ncbi:glycolate oxidase subunit GlcF [Kaarinaea lacus]
MQTRLVESILNTPQGREADRILRTCVHCGFCTATCPTYQLLGDELDGPRGRIYQIKMALEGAQITRHTQQHLDRCLTCLNCETTCPSGVQYHRLLDIGREYVEQQVPRTTMEKLSRWLLRTVLTRPWLVTPFLRVGQFFQPILPRSLAQKVPPKQQLTSYQLKPQPRKMLMLAGCVQPAMTPRTNHVTAQVLNQLGIEVIEAPGVGCCGALSHHLSVPDEARDYMRRNIDAWVPYLDQGAEAIIITASGCGAMVKDYAALLQDDPEYAAKAQRVSGVTRDLSEILTANDIKQLKTQPHKRIAFHPPCTLQHAQQLNGRVESLLEAAGFDLVRVHDKHLCCGSAGSYSVLQAKLANQLRERKLHALQSEQPEMIVTANIGCQLHLQAGTGLPVKHWIELFAADV